MLSTKSPYATPRRTQKTASLSQSFLRMCDVRTSLYIFRFVAIQFDLIELTYKSRHFLSSSSASLLPPTPPPLSPTFVYFHTLPFSHSLTLSPSFAVYGILIADSWLQHVSKAFCFGFSAIQFRSSKSYKPKFKHPNCNPDETEIEIESRLALPKPNVISTLPF